MVRIKILIIAFIGLLCVQSCYKQRNNNGIVLTTSFSSIPDEPRFGIEIKNDSMFYCEEDINNFGQYKYYYCIYESDKLDNIGSKIKSAFNIKKELTEAYDATLCQLNIYGVNGNSKTLFYLEALPDNKWKVVNNLIDLRKCDLIPMSYHKFPEELLKAKMPDPPPISVPTISKK